MEYIYVLIIAASGFAVGAVWYMFLFPKQWSEASGISADAESSPIAYVVAALAALSAAGFMRHMFLTAGITGIGGCAISGAGLGLFVVAPWLILQYAFLRKPRMLWWVDGGHIVAAFTVMGGMTGLLF
jgi:hypothetical protein